MQRAGHIAVGHVLPEWLAWGITSGAINTAYVKLKVLLLMKLWASSTAVVGSVACTAMDPHHTKRPLHAVSLDNLKRYHSD